MEKVKEVLGEELFNQVAEKLGDKKLIFDHGDTMIPKTRLDEVIQQRDGFKKQLETVNNEMAGFKDKIKSADDLRTQLTALNEKNVALQADFEKKLKTQKLNSAIDTALIQNKAKNPAAVRALLKMDSISLDGENVIGLNDQLEKIKKSDDYLFGKEVIQGDDHNDNSTPPATGKFGGYESKTEWVKNDPIGFKKARDTGFK